MAAIARNSGNSAVFYVDSAGHLQALEWDWVGGWQAPQQVLPAAMPVAFGSPVSVVERRVNATGDPIIDNDTLDAFTVGQDGHVLHARWRYGDDNYKWNPARAEEITALATGGAAIGAITPYAGTIQVSARRDMSSLLYTWFENVENNANNWQKGELLDGGGTLKCGDRTGRQRTLDVQ